ncbi:hypothetical protein [Streptomyces sp. DH12]|uniref:hypothetical protein n=1 Tax=Streptomyces sp. DH12 TaxID=2857010 RepID=UPI001E3BBE17|nr:hypothetical protein [Streptomyces sp. DH12]
MSTRFIAALACSTAACVAVLIVDPLKRTDEFQASSVANVVENSEDSWGWD